MRPSGIPDWNFVRLFFGRFSFQTVEVEAFLRQVDKDVTFEIDGVG